MASRPPDQSVERRTDYGPVGDLKDRTGRQGDVAEPEARKND